MPRVYVKETTEREHTHVGTFFTNDNVSHIDEQLMTIEHVKWVKSI